MPPAGLEPATRCLEGDAASAVAAPGFPHRGRLRWYSVGEVERATRGAILRQPIQLVPSCARASGRRVVEGRLQSGRIVGYSGGCAAGCGTLVACRWVPELSPRRCCRDCGRGGNGQARSGVLLRRLDGRGARCPRRVVRRRPRAARPRTRAHRGRAGEAFVTEMNAWLAQRNASVEDVHYVITEPCGFEEVVLHLQGETGRVDLPAAILADHKAGGSTSCGSTQAAGRSQAALRTAHPCCHPTRRYGCPMCGRVSARALGRRRRYGRGELRTGRLRSRARGWPVHPHRPRRPARLLRAFVLERRRHSPGALRTRRRLGARARWSTTSCAGTRTDLPPQAGVAVYVRGKSGKLAAARIYDDADPPLGQRA
jgi:hypothetical protein